MADRPLAAGRPGTVVSWLQKADLIFVDNPVGAGFSYVEGNEKKLPVRTDTQAVADMVALLKDLTTEELPTLRSSPLFLVAESYGGKYAAALGVQVVRAVRAGQLALGDSFISPEDITLTYGQLLLDVSRLDSSGADYVNKQARTVQQQIGSVGLLPCFAGLLQFLARRRDGPACGVSTGQCAGGQVLDVPQQQTFHRRLDWRRHERSHQAEAKNYPRIRNVDELLSYGVNVTVYMASLT